jgi:hypothetical protein
MLGYLVMAATFTITEFVSVFKMALAYPKMFLLDIQISRIEAIDIQKKRES